MDLKKLPPAMLLALGLACGDDDGGESDTVNACLTPLPPTSSDTGTEVGPCLSPPEPNTDTGMDTGATGDGGTTIGPCLSPPEPSTGTDTGTGTDTDTDTDGSGSGTDSGGSTGMGAAPSRDAALARVLERGSLPADVAARLQSRGEED